MNKSQPVFLYLLIFFFFLSGCSVKINPAPEILVTQDTTEIPSVDGVFEFGNVTVGGESAEVVFTIENTGTSNLKLTGKSEVVSLTGNNASDFELNQTDILSMLLPGESTTFTIIFRPSDYSLRTAMIEILSNDRDEESYAFVISGSGVLPGINVKQGSTDIPTTTGSYDFGVLVVGASSPAVVFSIENIGDGNLNLLGTGPYVEISGADVSEFTVNQSSINPEIFPGGSTTFTISFHPTSIGAKTANISIENDDSSKNPYTFSIKGEAIVAPEINVVDPDGKTIASGSGSFGFGEILVGEMTSATFEIQNLGNDMLSLTGSELVQLDGTGIDVFTITAMPTDSIDPGTSTSFTIEFAPTDVDSYSVTVIIENNDSNENPYTFTISGDGVAPEINVRQDTSNIESGTGVYDFGNVVAETSSPEITFTIENVGAGEINLTSDPFIEISGPDAALFAINQSTVTTPLTNGSPTTFTIIFTPLVDDAATATISIANDDTDENPYTFTVAGTGIYVPEISVYTLTHQDIPNGSGTLDCGSVLVNSQRLNGFFVENVGKADLMLTETPVLSFSGTDAAAFTLFNNPQSTIHPGENVLVVFWFSPTAKKQHSATATIKNNDSDENPYTFTITGTGVTPEIEVHDSSSNNITNSTGSFDFGAVTVRTKAEETFAITNSGDAGLQLTGTELIEITGTDANLFKVTKVPASTIAPGNSTTFTIEFAPTSIASFNATVSIANTDLDENPFTFSLTGKGLKRFNQFDFNGDGLQDVVSSALLDDDGGQDSGCAFIFLGSTSLQKSYIASDADVKLIGEAAGDTFGSSVACAGDINGDGFEDVIVGAFGDSDFGASTGSAYIFFGSQNPPSSINAANADVKLVGEAAGDMLGYDVSCAGDINGDGIDDVAVSAYMNAEGGFFAGSVYIFFGKLNWDKSYNVSNANVKLVGQNQTVFGASISYAGDINNDKIDDFVVGTPGDREAGTNAGCAYVFFGKQSWGSKVNATSANVKILGKAAEASLGIDVSTAGDVNNDGIRDLIVGALGDSSNGSKTGAAFMFLGKTSWSAKISASDADVSIYGEITDDRFGCSVSTAKDVNNDGIDDIIVGAYDNDAGGAESGSAYIFYGIQTWNKTISAAHCNVKIIGVNADNNFGCSVSSAGDVNGDSIDDLIVGALKADTGDYYSGCTYIIFGRTNFAQTFNAVDSDVTISGDSTRDSFGKSVGGAK